MLSEAKTGRPVTTFSRSLGLLRFESGRPNRTARDARAPDPRARHGCRLPATSSCRCSESTACVVARRGHVGLPLRRPRTARPPLVDGSVSSTEPASHRRPRGSRARCVPKPQERLNIDGPGRADAPDIRMTARVARPCAMPGRGRGGCVVTEPRRFIGLVLGVALPGRLHGRDDNVTGGGHWCPPAATRRPPSSTAPTRAACSSTGSRPGTRTPTRASGSSSPAASGSASSRWARETRRPGSRSTW